MRAKGKEKLITGPASLRLVASTVLLLLAALVIQEIIITIYVDGNMKYSLLSSLFWLFMYRFALNTRAILGFSVTPSEWVLTASGKALSGASKEEIASAANRSVLGLSLLLLLLIISIHEKLNSQFAGAYEERLFAASVGAAVGVVSGFGIVRLALRTMK